MADNTVLNSGTGGDTIATDDIAGVKHQQVKVEWGVDGTATPVSAANPMPVVQTGTHAVNATLAAETTKVIGTVNIAAAQTVATVTTVGAVTAITNALPAGTNNIGDVDVLSLPALPSGSNAIGTVTAVGAAAEDAAASGNPVLVGGRYDSSPRTLETGDVGAVALNASGQILVEIAAGAGSGGTAAADDADFTAGTTSGTPVMGSYQSSPTAVTDGDMGIIGITANREVKVAVTSGGITGAVEDAAASGAAEGVLGIVVRDDALATLTPVDGDYTVQRTNARGATWVALDSTAAQTVTLAAGTATNEVVGDAAHDAAAAGNPVLVGAYASAAAPSDVSGDADAVRLWALRSGALAVQPTYAGVLGTTGNGASGTGVQRVTLADNSTGVLATVSTVTTVGTVTNITNQGHLADDAAFTPATTRVMMNGYFADETATDSVDEGDGGAARMTLDRKQIVTLAPHTAGGPTIFRSLDIDESEEEIKSTAGQIYWIHAMNMVATARYLKFYNATAANVTVGTTTPVLTFPIPANSTTGAGFVFNVPQGIPFSTAISVACTTGVADADTGAPGANDVIINIGYL